MNPTHSNPSVTSLSPSNICLAKPKHFDPGISRNEGWPGLPNPASFGCSNRAYFKPAYLEMRGPDFQATESNIFGDTDCPFYFPSTDCVSGEKHNKKEKMDKNVEMCDRKQEQKVIQKCHKTNPNLQSFSCDITQPLGTFLGEENNKDDSGNLKLDETGRTQKGETTIKKLTSKKKCNKFMLHRTIFRGMSKYYKNRFASKSKVWQRKKGKKQKVSPMDEIVLEFVMEEFKYLRTCNPQIKFEPMVNPLLVVLHSHRYKKEEEFTKHLDFSIIRDLLYWYSSEALSRFMDHPVYAFLLHHFYICDKDKFLSSNTKNQPAEFWKKLEDELDELHTQALACSHMYII